MNYACPIFCPEGLSDERPDPIGPDGGRRDDGQPAYVLALQLGPGGGDDLPGRRLAAVPVVDGGVPVGVLTDRDVALASADGDAPLTRLVTDIMSPGAICVQPDTPLEEVRQKLGEQAAHYLLVVDGAGERLGDHHRVRPGSRHDRGDICAPERAAGRPGTRRPGLETWPTLPKPSPGKCSHSGPRLPTRGGPSTWPPVLVRARSGSGFEQRLVQAEDNVRGPDPDQPIGGRGVDAGLAPATHHDRHVGRLCPQPPDQIAGRRQSVRGQV